MIKVKLFALSIVAIFAITLTGVSAQNGTIRGKVYNKANKNAVEFANILIVGTDIGTTSDLDGNFLITGVPPGFARLTVSYIGFDPLLSPEIQIIGNSEVFIELPLQENVTQLTEVVVERNFNTKRIEAPLSQLTITVQDVEKIAGINRDISKAIQILPGVGSTSANRNDLIVRGGGPSENVFYLDGIEIPVLNHFTTQGASGGAVSIVNPDFVREIDFYTGAYPANRNNALSSVMEIRQKDGSKDRVHFKLNVGASDAGLTVDGPIGEKVNFIASVRQSYLQLLFSLLQLPFLPNYNDLQLRFNFKFDPKNELTINALVSCDRMRLNRKINNPDETQQYYLRVLPEYFQWNYMLGATYRYFTDTHYDLWVLSRNMLNNRNYKYIENDKSQLKSSDYESSESENRLRFESVYTTLPIKVMFGAGIMLSHYDNRTYRLFYNDLGNQSINYSSDFYLFSYQLFTQLSDSYFDDKFNVSVGLSFVGNSYNKNMANLLNQTSPRISLSYSFTPQWSLNASAGRYAQRPAYTTMGYRNNEGTWVNKGDSLKYIKSYQAVLGVEYLVNSNFKFTLEGFFKYYNDYPISIEDGISLACKGGDYGQIGDEAVTSIGKGRSYGIELLGQLRNFNGLTANVSYTLYWSEFTNIDGTYLPSSWDGRHIINLNANYRFLGTWSVSARWRYTGGTPYSPIDELSYYRIPWEINGRAYTDFDAYNSLRLPPSHQLDVRADKDFFFKKWSLNIYVDIQNAYYFKSPGVPIYTNKDPDGNILGDPEGNPEKQELRILKSLSGTIIPTLGVIFRI